MNKLMNEQVGHNTISTRTSPLLEWLSSGKFERRQTFEVVAEMTFLKWRSSLNLFESLNLVVAKEVEVTG